MSFTGPFSFNLLANRDEIAIAHEGRVLLLKNPVIETVNYKYDAGFETMQTMSNDDNPLKMSTPSEVRLGLEIRATEWVEGPQNGIDMPKAVEDMTVEELLHAVNQKIDER